MRLPLPLRLALPLLGALLLGAGCTTAPPVEEPVPTGPLPDDSIYQLAMPLTDQAGQHVDLGLHRGHPTIVTMFYASCPAACPTLIADIKAIERDLPPPVASDLRVVMVSFDSDADTPEVLTGLARDHALDLSRWTLGSAHADQVRTLAAVLGISYRRLDTGHYNHSAVITLLDEEGRPLARVEGLNQPAGQIVAALDG